MEITVLARELLQLDSLDGFEVGLKATLFDSLALFIRFNIRPKENSYIFQRDLRLLETQCLDSPFSVGADMEVSFEYSVV